MPDLPSGTTPGLTVNSRLTIWSGYVLRTCGRPADSEGEIDREPLRARYLVPTAGAGRRPHRALNQEADMKVSVTRSYPVLIMRDQLGRFAKLGVALVEKARKVRRSARRLVQVTAVQLVLF